MSQYPKELKGEWIGAAIDPKWCDEMSVEVRRIDPHVKIITDTSLLRQGWDPISPEDYEANLSIARAAQGDAADTAGRYPWGGGDYPKEAVREDPHEMLTIIAKRVVRRTANASLFVFEVLQSNGRTEETEFWLPKSQYEIVTPQIPEGKRADIWIRLPRWLWAQRTMHTVR